MTDAWGGSKEKEIEPLHFLKAGKKEDVSKL